MLENKVAVITGASSGLGAAISELLVDQRVIVYGLARREDKLNAVKEELGARFIPLICDITDQVEVRTSFETILDEEGQLDILINNAGLGLFGPFESVSQQDWYRQMEVNLTGVFHCTQAAVPQMKKQNSTSGFGGHIINIASVAGLIGNPQISVYNATKFGLRGMSEALMKELRTDGIKVSCVYPGSIRTEFFETAGIDISGNPMDVVDVAQTVVHLLETPENYLISEVVMRPLRPRG